MPRHLVEPHDHNTRSLTSGSAVTPSTSNPVWVLIQLSATGIAPGDDADFSISVKTSGGSTLSGYPLNVGHSRGATTGGEVDRDWVVGILVPTNHQYEVTDNSSGVTTSMSATEDGL